MAIVDYHGIFGGINDIFNILCRSDDADSTKQNWLGRGGDYGARFGVIGDDGCRHGNDDHAQES